MAVKYKMLIILLPFLLLIFSGACKCSKPVRKPDSNGDGSDLQLLDKSVVKIIQTEHGDIYECIDFYEQPALKHPSLKNHNFHPQMRPSSSPKRMRNNGDSGQFEEVDIKLKDGGCPIGKVPIRRMEKDELTQLELVKQNLSASRTNPNSVFRHTGTNFALAQTQNTPGTKHYNGAGAALTVYNPKIGPGQYSSAELIIQNDSDMIEFGMTVNPGVYKDTVTRLFLYTISGSTHCFNSNCGFVIVNTEIPLDAIISPVSTVWGATYTFSFFVYKDEKNGNWWLELGRDGTIVGFWPQGFFSGLAHSASYVACGGEVYRPPGQMSGGRPGMGSGYIAFRRDPRVEAFCKRFVMVNEAHQVVHAVGTEEFSSNPNYTVVDNPRAYRPEHFVFFGGPLWDN